MVLKYAIAASEAHWAHEGIVSRSALLDKVMEGTQARCCECDDEGTNLREGQVGGGGETSAN